MKHGNLCSLANLEIWGRWNSNCLLFSLVNMTAHIICTCFSWWAKPDHIFRGIAALWILNKSHYHYYYYYYLGHNFNHAKHILYNSNVRDLCISFNCRSIIFWFKILMLIRMSIFASISSSNIPGASCSKMGWHLR